MKKTIVRALIAIILVAIVATIVISTVPFSFEAKVASVSKKGSFSAPSIAIVVSGDKRYMCAVGPNNLEKGQKISLKRKLFDNFGFVNDSFIVCIEAPLGEKVAHK